MATPRKGKDGWDSPERILKGFGEIAYDKSVLPVQRIQALVQLAKLAGMYREDAQPPTPRGDIVFEVIGVEPTETTNE